MQPGSGVKNPEDPELDAIKRRDLLLKMYKNKRKYKTEIDNDIPEYIEKMQQGPTKRLNILMYIHLAIHFGGAKCDRVALQVLKNLKHIKPPEHMQNNEEEKKRIKKKYAWVPKPGEINPIIVAESPIEALVDYMPKRVSYQKDIINIKEIMESVSIIGDIPRNVADLIEKTSLKKNRAYFVMAYAWSDFTEGMPLTNTCIIVLDRLGWLPLAADPQLHKDKPSLFRKRVKELFGFGIWRYVYYTLQGHSELVCYRKTVQNPQPSCMLCVVNDVCPSSLTRRPQHTYQDTLKKKGYLKGKRRKNLNISVKDLSSDLESEPDPDSSM